MWEFRADRLKAVREMKGLSQKEAALKVGITHRQQWHQWEAGHISPSVPTIVAIANKMGCSPAFFFVDDVDKNRQDEN